MDTQKIRDRIAACLYGGALGDALGYAVEFDRWKTIQKRYGLNGIQQPEMTDGKARVSDDTQMTLFTAEGMLLGLSRAGNGGEHDPVEEDIYQAYLCWLQTQGIRAESRWAAVSRLMKNPDMNHRRAPGITCLNALGSGEMGTIEHPVNNSKGCGGVMRTAPLGFLRSDDHTSGTALENGARAAAITHGHPLGWIPAGMLADIVERCLYGRYSSLRDLIEDSLEETVRVYADYEEIGYFEELIRRAVRLAEPAAHGALETASVDEPAIRSLGEGWVGEEALAVAVYAALRYPADIRRALAAAVNHSGDSDSTGAVAGNILGAWLGMDGMPEDWICGLELREEIEVLADGLQRVIGNR